MPNESRLIAMQDGNLTQVPGALSTGIGVGIQPYFDAPVMDANTIPKVFRLGGDQTDFMLVEGTSKKVKMLQTTGVVAPDGVVATGWVNKTGVTVPSGKWLWAQEA
jgi:hypothetical protein